VPEDDDPPAPPREAQPAVDALDYLAALLQVGDERAEEALLLRAPDRGELAREDVTQQRRPQPRCKLLWSHLFDSWRRHW
jgi:hypothetical protein